jgi:hypothetical protein
MVFTDRPPVDQYSLPQGACEAENVDGSRTPQREYQSGVICDSDFASNIGLYDPATEQFAYYAGNRIQLGSISLLYKPAAMCIYGEACVARLSQVPMCMSMTSPPAVEPSPPQATAVTNLTFRATDCSSTPLVGFSFKATVDVVPYSGQHLHADQNLRPKGGLGSPTAITYSGTTNAAGEIVIPFFAPEVSGSHTIRVVCVAGVCPIPLEQQIDVQVANLRQIPSSNYYTLTDSSGGNIGDNTKHDDINHYLTEAAARTLERIARAYPQAFVDPNLRTPQKIYVNDASLPLGGMFDFEGTWHPPHEEHRKGSVVDIRANNEEGAVPADMTQDFREIADMYNATAEIHGERSVGNRHIHLRLMGSRE